MKDTVYWSANIYKYFNTHTHTYIYKAHYYIYIWKKNATALIP